MLQGLKTFLDVIIPRFMEDRIAMYRDEEGNWQVLCSEADLTEEDEGEYECIGTIRILNLFGIGIPMGGAALPEDFVE